MDSLVKILVSWFPMIVLIAVWIYFMKKMKSPQSKTIEYLGRQNELLAKYAESNERIAVALEKLAEQSCAGR